MGKRIPMAEATLTIAVGVLHRYSKVMWISLMFSFVNIGYIIACGFASFGLYSLCGFVGEGGTREESWGEYAIWVGTTFVFFWGTLTLSYIVHAICAGVVGTWYFGTSRKRTVTDAFIRAITTSLGSLSFAAFIVAIIRTLQAMADKSQRKASKDGNAAAMIAALCIKCLLAIIGDLLDYLNGLAIVRVAVYGESFCTAAKRTMNMMKYRGMDQIINDDLSGMPVGLGCFIIYMICVPCMFTSYCSRSSQTAHYGCTHSCSVSVLSSFPFRFSQRSHRSFRVSTSYGAMIRQHLTRCTLVKQRC